jgi:hypothetical protein
MRKTTEGLDPREPTSVSSQDPVASLPRTSRELFGSPLWIPPCVLPMRKPAEELDPQEPTSASSQEPVANLPRINQEPVVNFLDPPLDPPLVSRL